MNEDTQYAQLSIETNFLDLFDALCERLAKAEALANIAMTEAFSENLTNTVRNYLWTLCNLIREASEINQILVNKQTQKKLIND